MKKKELKVGTKRIVIERYGKIKSQREVRMPIEWKNNTRDTSERKENCNQRKDEEMDRKENFKEYEGKEETEKERENRRRSERRKNENIREWLNQSTKQKEKRETNNEMEIRRTEEERRDDEIEDSTEQRRRISSATTNSGEKNRQFRNKAKSRTREESEVKIREQENIQRHKRKLEGNKEEEKSKKGKEDTADPYKERNEGHKKEEGENTRTKVRREANVGGSRENNDFYEWNSNKGEYFITIVLSKEKTTSSKKNNLIRIYRILINTGIRFEGLKMIGHNRAEVRYKNRQEANRALSEGRLKPEDYTTYIPQRWKMRKGVTHEWEDSIMELEDQLMPNQGVFTLERLKRKRMKDGKAVWEEGKSILIKMQGESLPTKLLIGYGHVWLRVEPFVEAVKQCFRCLRFGHIQAGCKSIQRKCFICTKEFHGRCEENPRCMNCGGNHLSVTRELPNLPERVIGEKNNGLQECVIQCSIRNDQKRGENK